MSIPRRLYAWLRDFLAELSDEAGYARHLKVTGHTHSAAEWKRFADSRYRRKYQHGKCC